MFDLNHEGELDSFERGAEFMFFNDVVMKDTDKESESDDEDSDSEDWTKTDELVAPCAK